MSVTSVLRQSNPGELALLKEGREPLHITCWHDIYWLFELERAKYLRPFAQAL